VYGKPDACTEESKIKIALLAGLEIDRELVFKR